MEAIKAFVKGYSTSKTSTRRDLLENLLSAARGKELPVPAVKACVQTLGSTLFLYTDRGSKLGVQRVLDELCSNHGPGAIAVLCTVLEKACPYFRPPAGPAMRKPALTALQWSTLVARHSQDVNDVIVKSQARYAAFIVG
jgi:hypothetical protein